MADLGAALAANNMDFTIPETLRVLLPNGVVERLDLETYVAGVVAASMPGDAPMEALKALAVAARTFAGITRRHLDRGAEVCASRHCQTWESHPSAAASQAAEETRGVVAVYGSRLIDAYYFEHCDGTTRDATGVLIQAPPYLRAVSCPCGRATLKGHGIGMCQRGAQVWARSGETFDSILRHYYTGIALARATPIAAVQEKPFQPAPSAAPPAQPRTGSPRVEAPRRSTTPPRAWDSPRPRVEGTPAPDQVTETAGGAGIEPAPQTLDESQARPSQTAKVIEPIAEPWSDLILESNTTIPPIAQPPEPEPPSVTSLHRMEETGGHPREAESIQAEAAEEWESENRTPVQGEGEETAVVEPPALAPVASAPPPDTMPEEMPAFAQEAEPEPETPPPPPVEEGPAETTPAPVGPNILVDCLPGPRTIAGDLTRPGLIVRITDAVGNDVITVSGTAPLHGPGGFEAPLAESGPYHVAFDGQAVDVELGDETVFLTYAT